MMEPIATALFFFYGIFWAACLSSISVFMPFDTASWFKSSTAPTAIRRFLASVIVVNFSPIAGLWLLYQSFLMNLRPPGGIFIVAIASMCVFSIPRFLHGFILNKRTAKCFYTDDDIKRLSDHHQKTVDPCVHHLVPGAIYVVGFVGIAWLLARLVN